MEAGLDIYRARFDNVQTGLTREVDRGMVLTEELLNELEGTTAELKQTKLELDNEREARNRLRQEVEEIREWKQRQKRRPFVVALIDADADCYVFHDSFITRGVKGGEDAADTLLVALQQYVRKVTCESDGMDILVRAFANVSGLSAALQRSGRLNGEGQLRAFATV
ncbi:hypothetical protein EDB81DRAFT_830063 [Dactylonectria macrodidyma]|uniref:DUF7923 domain-containing protein n=1 Tax=Dactylonectria macrodidyma TaxID=307937 RepID=A0A9P9D279_9HYPO|nr:hypothetical protein EDB81DRAFT_830063 [Dactylonectria macrodidyma]